jgi:hypothetical protein
MQETSLPPDAGFVVDWQLSEENSVVIDLSTAETEVYLPVDPQVRSVTTRR